MHMFASEMHVKPKQKKTEAATITSIQMRVYLMPKYCTKTKDCTNHIIAVSHRSFCI